MLTSAVSQLLSLSLLSSSLPGILAMAGGRGIAAGAVQALLCLASCDSNAGSSPLLKGTGVTLGVSCKGAPDPLQV